MNFLAHLFLAERTDAAALGSLWPDFARGASRRAIDRLPDPVRAAALQHRQIDRFTDAHPVCARSRARIQPPHRRVAGVLVDIFYDHFLAAAWRDYSDEPLTHFTHRCYAALERQRELAPPALQLALPRMAADDWLGSYRRLASIDRALAGIARRFRREVGFTGAIGQLTAHYGPLRDDFEAFFPELIRHTRP